MKNLKLYPTIFSVLVLYELTGLQTVIGHSWLYWQSMGRFREPSPMWST